MKDNLRGSLRGENKVRRDAGAGSSPAPSARSTRTRLWRRLRNYDRMISILDADIQFIRWTGLDIRLDGRSLDKLLKRREIIDAKRKAVRRKLKGYEN